MSEFDSTHLVADDSDKKGSSEQNTNQKSDSSTFTRENREVRNLNIKSNSQFETAIFQAQEIVKKDFEIKDLNKQIEGLKKQLEELKGQKSSGSIFQWAVLFFIIIIFLFFISIFR